MKICAYQGPVDPGDIEANLARTETALKQAEEKGAAILCMPEYFVQGWLGSRKQNRERAIEVYSRQFDSILKRYASCKPQLLLGFIERDQEEVYISQAVIQGGGLLGVYRKAFPATSEVDRGEDFPLFKCEGVPYGIIVCADSSAVEPARILAMRGARVIFSPHFNYIPYESLDRHTRTVRASHVARAVENRVFVVRSNVIVREAQGVAMGEPPGAGVGDSFVVDPEGRFIAEAGLFTETLLFVDLPNQELAQAGLGYLKAPFLFPTPGIAEVLSAEIRRYAERSVR